MLLRKLTGDSFTIGSGDISGCKPIGSMVALKGLGLLFVLLPNGEAEGADPKGLLMPAPLMKGFCVSESPQVTAGTPRACDNNLTSASPV